MHETRPGRTIETELIALEGADRRRKTDSVVTEEPLELRLVAGGTTRTLAVTMRTPGNDFELAAGFVYDESIVRARSELGTLTYCVDSDVDPEQQYNIVTIELNAGAAAGDFSRFERHFTMNSSCGICGRAQLEALAELGVAPIDDGLCIDAALLYTLPNRMREAQRIFASTGGLHAAALFDDRGEAIAVREDIGRHNAVDKLIGWGLLNERLPFARSILMVSGRASYEIVQKSTMARIPIVCSVSAPSSLAIQLARAFNVTLVGFLRGDRANVYTCEQRVAR